MTTLFVTHRSGRSRPIGGSPVFSVRPAGAYHLRESVAAAAGNAQPRRSSRRSARKCERWWRRPRPAPGKAEARTQASRLSMAKRTSSEDERKPSFWRMMEEVLAIVLYDEWTSQAISERLLPALSSRNISISRERQFRQRALGERRPGKCNAVARSPPADKPRRSPPP